MVNAGHKVYGPKFKIARAAALERSRNICQFCGCHEAVEGHHWAGTVIAGPYPSDGEITEHDLTGLCRPCHKIATTLRRFHKRGGDMWQFLSALERSIEECDTESLSRVNLASSSVTERPDWTRGPLPTLKRMRSRVKQGLTEPQAMTPDSESLNAKPVFGSAMKERQPSHMQQSAQ